MRALAASVLLLIATPALADTNASEPAPAPVPAGDPSLRPPGWPTFDTVPFGPDVNEAPGDISNVLFVNRCVGGCEMIKSETNNSQTYESSICDADGNDPLGTTYTVQEFGHGDQAWEDLMSCIRQVYAPYDVVVTDEEPTSGAYHMAIAAGAPSQIKYSNQAGGVAPSGCDPRNNVISYSFLNTYPTSQINEMCATVAQESAHSFGLGDHLYDCTDPMTYLALNGECGRKFFRNKLEPCGEFQQFAECNCTGTRMNPHVTLLGTFGPGEDPPPPEATLTYPSEGATITASSIVSVNATDDRGVFKVEAYLNGWLWGTFELDDSITPPFTFPTNITVDLDDGYPDGAYEVHAVAYNDLGISTTTASVNVMKGAPCTSADSCLDGQTCESGGCFWPEPSGELGDACTFDQFCIGPNTFDGNCANVGGNSICTQSCFTGVNDNCPSGFACQDGTFVCGPETDDGGCCSTGADSRGELAARVVLIGLVGGFLVRRRRRA